MKEPVHVLGAGIVGICCALELQRSGFQVTLVDRRGPGEETSSGNAGVLSYSNVTPLADPALFARLHRLIMNREADFRLHYPHLPSLLPWLLRFLRRCQRKTYLADGDAMSQLTLASIDMHRQWIAEAGLESLLNPLGGLKLYRKNETFERDRLERELLTRCGIRHHLMDADEISAREPHLKPIFERGVLIDESISLRNPEKLCKAYADMFVEAGGEIRCNEVRGLTPLAHGWQLATASGTQNVARVVVCMGAWTASIIESLGYANPLAIERGYHTVFAPQPGCHLSAPIFDVDASYVMSPMEAGLRVTTGTNLTHRETVRDPRQLEQVIPRVREAFPMDRMLVNKPWMGRRPTVPDTLPIIGPAPRHENLWLAFAHSHMGLTMGPITGRLIANFMGAREQPFSPRACDPRRYL